MSSNEAMNAEALFRAAFERLKHNKPEVLQKNTPVTQNNVAREAGRDPSALKKDRYPLLILEIQSWVTVQRESAEKKTRRRDNRSRTLGQKLEDRQRQIEKLSSLVAAQDNLISELLDEIDRLKARKVVKMDD